VDSSTLVNRIRTLDGWRAIAILMVTIFHASESILGDRPDILYYTRFCALGVDVFFALSGILITNLLLDERDRTGQIDLKGFYIRRCFRVLLPCYFYLALISVCGVIHSRSEFLSSVFFFRNYTNGGHYTSHLWSLAVEEHFYLLWPIALVVAHRYAQQVAMWGAVGFGLWRMVGTLAVPTLPGIWPIFRTDYRLDSLLWGCVIGVLLHKSNPLLKRITPLAWIAILGAYMLCFRQFSLVARMAMPALLPLLIVATAQHPKWILSRFLESAPMEWIGKISYSLYLWQMLFLVYSTHSPFWWQLPPTNIVLAFATATICYYCLDAPVRKVGYRLAKRASPNRLETIPPSFDLAAIGTSSRNP
jgi:peptidoglycan/LPS O-acetylase OafA/YrhL